MGCHTWFARPVTDKEFNFFKKNAIAHAWYLNGNTEENIEMNCVDLDTYFRVKNSVERNTNYWWKNGWGTKIFNGMEERTEYTYVFNGIMYLDLADPINPIFPELKRYHDVFRVKNYPSKNIHSQYELKRWMRKKYFDLNEQQLDKISEFFRENLDGIISFG